MTEKRLIDANALSDEVEKSKRNNPHPQGMVRVNHRNEHDHFMRMIFDAPTVDAVEVVRCKECKFYELKYYPDNTKAMTCENSKAIWTRTPPDAFCSYGERRIDNGQAER